jgi:hypothetical protein
MRLHRPSPSMVVALAALTVALGGTSYAAVKLPKNSVGSKQIKKNAVTGAKVKDHSLFANDFAAGQLPRGPKGDTGAPGPAGVAGPQGAAIAYAHVNADGSIVGAESKNLEVTGRGNNPTVPVYCMNHTAGGAINVLVTSDAAQTDPARTQMGVTTSRAAMNAVACPASSDFEVTADLINPEDRGVNAGFFVAVIAG